MKFKKLTIPEVILCEPEVKEDNRGYFSEMYRSDRLFQFTGFPIHFCQENESKSTSGVLRGLHYQMPPFAQTKLVRATQGEILDVAVDLRQDSATFGNYVSVVLSEKNKRQLLIPRGFAHGFLVLSEYAVVNYKVDNFYNPARDRGVAFDDEDLGIDWGLKTSAMLVSSKDNDNPLFRDAEYFTNSEALYD